MRVYRVAGTDTTVGNAQVIGHEKRYSDPYYLHHVTATYGTGANAGDFKVQFNVLSRNSSPISSWSFGNCDLMAMFSGWKKPASGYSYDLIMYHLLIRSNNSTLLVGTNAGNQQVTATDLSVEFPNATFTDNVLNYKPW